MSGRHITAVVLLSGTTTARTHAALRTALTEQTRRAERIVVVAPSDLPEEVSAAIARDLGDEAIDEILPVSAALSRAGAVRETLDLLFRGTRAGAASGSTRAEAAPGRLGASEASDERGDRDDSRDRAPESGREAEPLEAVESRERAARPSRRRARAVDSAAVESERTQRAETLAQVPLRLREESSRPGRRVAAAEGAAGESWLWFVVDGATPGLDALERQLEVVERSPNTAAIGAKRVRQVEDRDDLPLTAESADALVDVGLTLTHGGRIITGVDPGEIDQGQADWRQDVLAVPLPGMLVREQTLREVGGLDPDLPAPWAEIDLCRRIWRSGERVAVQASSRVLHPYPTRPLLERLQEQRTGQVLTLLKQRRLLHALLTLVLLPLETLLRMLGAVAASAPRLALMELRAALAVLPRTRRVLARGRQDRRRARVPRGRLAPLYLPRGEGMRRWIDDTWSRLFADDDRRRRIRYTTWGIAGTRHGLEDADYGRHIVWTGVVALAATVLGLFALRGLFGRGELTGPGLRPLPESWDALWAAGWSSWIPGGLGERGPGDPLIRLLGHLPPGGGLLIEAVIFAAIPVSALVAWWASGAITRAVGARLVITTVWALAPSLLTALAIGAWPLLLVHLLLPLLALAIGRAIGLPHKVSQASVSAAAAGGLLLLVIGAVQPVLVLLAAAALVLIAIAAPGRRRRLFWVLLPSLALHAPYLPSYLGHPRTLLAVTGVPPTGATATAGDLAGLWPVAPQVQELLSPLLGETAALLLPLLPIAPVALAALCAPLLAGAAGRAGRFSVLLAALGLLAVLLARGTWTGTADGHLVTPPLHGLLSVILLALMVGAGATFDGLARREAHDSGIRRAATGLIGTVVAVACVATVAGWTLVLPGQLRLERSEWSEVPAAAADQGRTDARARVLVLTGEEDGTIRAELVVHGGDTVIQHAAIADARDVATVDAGQAVDDDPASAALRETVAGMLSGDGGPAGMDAGDGEERAVAHLAIAYVVVPGDPAQQQELMHTLDSSAQLEKVTESSRGGLWRVVDAEPRALVAGGAAPLPLASDVIEASGTIPAEDTGRSVVLSERFDTAWRATLDGDELEPVEIDGWAQGFEVPAGVEGEIDVHREQPLLPLWQLLLYGATALTALLAIPWRVRTRTAEEMYG